jgi:hypothetical protein
MPRAAAENARIILILARVSEHLRRRATATPERTAQVFASLALFFGNLIARPHILTRAAERIDRPKAKQEIAGETENRHVTGSSVNRIRQSGQVHGRRVDKKGSDQENDGCKGPTSAPRRSRLPEPCELHPSHHLCHGDLRAANGAPQGGMTVADREAVKETRLPASSGRIETSANVGGRERRQECLTFLDSSFGLKGKQINGR